MRALAVVLMLILSASPVAAEKDKVYKWVDKDGVVHYGSEPPSDNATPAKLPPLQTYKEGTLPDLSRFDKGGKAVVSAYQVQLVTPAPDETFRGGERTVPVAVVVTPALREGQRLIYLLDGTPDSQPTTDTSHAFTNVNRGMHTAAVSLVNETGEELARSNTVTFHMKPPQVKR